MAILNKSLFNFLEELAKNNNREWFQDHKDAFDAEKKNVELFCQELMEKLVNFDEVDSFRVYRIYRDTRFSLDKTPYKNHFGIIMKRKQPYNRGSFYIHLEPGNVFIGGGFWGPEKEDLFRIRKAIEVEDDLVDIIAAPDFQEKFGSLYGEQLKTAPKGFDKLHPRVDLLRYKQFLVIKKFTEEQALRADFISQIVEAYQAMLPFFEYMTSVLTTDENGESLLD